MMIGVAVGRGYFDVRAQLDLLKQIKLCLPVQPRLQKYFHSLLTQITCISPAVPSHRGALARSSRTRGGMRWTLIAL